MRGRNCTTFGRTLDHHRRSPNLFWISVILRYFETPVAQRRVGSKTMAKFCTFYPFFCNKIIKGATYDDHLSLIGKRVVDFLLLLIELFSLGVTAESTRAKRDRKSAISLHGAGWPKISGRRGRPTNHSSSQKTRLNDLSYGINLIFYTAVIPYPPFARCMSEKSSFTLRLNLWYTFDGRPLRGRWEPTYGKKEKEKQQNVSPSDIPLSCGLIMMFVIKTFII